MDCDHWDRVDISSRNCAVYILATRASSGAVEIRNLRKQEKDVKFSVP